MFPQFWPSDVLTYATNWIFFLSPEDDVLPYEFTPRFFRCPQGVYEDGGNNWVEEINKEIGMVKVENINGRRNQYHVPWNADDETWKSDKTWQDIQTKIKQEFTNAKTNKCDLVLLSHDHYDNHRQA
jgi:hypothetical protein